MNTCDVCHEETTFFTQHSEEVIGLTLSGIICPKCVEEHLDLGGMPAKEYRAGAEIITEWNDDYVANLGELGGEAVLRVWTGIQFEEVCRIPLALSPLLKDAVAAINKALQCAQS